MGNCSSTKPLLIADFPAPLAPTTATRLTCDTVRFTSTIEEYTGSPRTSCAGRPCCGSSRPQGDQAPRRRIFIVPLLSKKCAFNSGYFSRNGGDIVLNSLERLQLPVLHPPDINHVQETRGLNKHEHIAVHQLSRAQVHLHLSRRRSSSSRATPSSPRGPGQSDLPGQTRAALGRPEPPPNCTFAEHVEHFEHNLRHVLPNNHNVHKSFREKDGVILISHRQ